jgi:hypothetical protein
MAALVAAGGQRLEIGLDWHPPIWLGRPRPRRMPDTGRRLDPHEYRVVQTAKFQRRLNRRAQLLDKATPSAT